MPTPICSLLLTSIPNVGLFGPAAALNVNMCVAALKDVSEEQFFAPLILSNVKDKSNSCPIDAASLVNKHLLDDQDKPLDKGVIDI